MKRRECLKLIGSAAAASWARASGGEPAADSQARRSAPGFGVFLSPGAFIRLELAPSLIPGESMSARRVIPVGFS